MVHHTLLIAPKEMPELADRAIFCASEEELIAASARLCERSLAIIAWGECCMPALLAAARYPIDWLVLIDPAGSLRRARHRMFAVTAQTLIICGQDNRVAGSLLRTLAPGALRLMRQGSSVPMGAIEQFLRAN